MRMGMGFGVNRALAIGAPFSPADLFAASEKGYWYDPSDFSTMFQDIAGTTPVTAAGQFVGKILDKSGNGNHLTAMSASARAVLQQTAGGHYYIDCDGIDDGYVTVGAVDAGAATKATMFFAVKPDTFVLNILIESSATATGLGAYLVYLSDNGDGTAVSQSLFVGSSSTSKAQATGYPPAAMVMATQYDYTQAAEEDEIILRRDGVVLSPTYPGAAAGNGPFSNETTYLLGRGGTQYLFDGGLYGVIGRFAETTAGEITATETWLNEHCGAF